METNTTRSVTDLPSGERQALEHLLGRPLGEQQQVFIMTFTPGVMPDEAMPDEATRAAARDRLEQTFAKNQRHAGEHAIAADEADAAIAEAMDHVRDRKN